MSTGEKRSARPAETRTRLTQDEKAYLFANLLRNPVLFALARDYPLGPQDIDPATDGHLVCLWRAGLNLAGASGGALPEPDERAHILLEIEARKVAELDPDTVRQEHVVQLFGSDPSGGLLTWVYGLTAGELSEERSRDLLADYLEERMVLEPLMRLADRVAGCQVPASLQPFIDRIENQRARLSGLTAPKDADTSPFLDLSAKPTLELFTTGLSFLDRFMNGGQAYGESYTVMGPTGAGKTILGGQIFMQGALHEQMLHHQDQTRPLRHWYYFAYEMPDELRYRLWAHAAQIDCDVLMRHEPLSTRGALKEYELGRFAERIQTGEDVPGEKERLADAEALWGRHRNFWVVDFSGKTPGVGDGGVGEIARYLEAERRNGRPVAGVVIDYAGLVVDRYIQAGHAEQDQVYSLLNFFVQRVTNQLNDRFGNLSWILHQLHGDAAKRAPTARYHHADAQGARNFANAAWFSFQIGNKDASKGCCTISCSKSRRAPGTDHAAIVRIDGAVRTMVDEDDNYAVSTVNRQIVRRSYEGRIVNPFSNPSGNQNASQGLRPARARNPLAASADEIAFG